MLLQIEEKCIDITFVSENVGDKNSGLDVVSTYIFCLDHRFNCPRISFKSLWWQTEGRARKKQTDFVDDKTMGGEQLHSHTSSHVLYRQA